MVRLDVGETVVTSQCSSLSMISGRSRDGRIMSGGVSYYSMAARPLGGKKEGVTPTGGSGRYFKVSLYVRRA